MIAHGLYADQFGPIGEEGAYRTHAVVTQDPLAIWALATETRAQNSWVNYGPQMRGSDGQLLKKGDPGYLAVPDRDFAEQKAVLLPVDDLLTGVPEIDKKIENLREMLTPEEAMGSLAKASDSRYFPGIQDGILLPNGQFIESNRSHGESFASWLKRNPNHAFAKKLTGDKTDPYGILDEAIKHGAIRVVSGFNYGTRNVELELSKSMTSSQRKFLELKAIEAGQKVTYFDLERKRFETFYEPPAGEDYRYFPGVGERIPELEDAAKKLQSGSLSKEKYSNLVDKYKPVRPYTSVPKPATMEEMRGALASNKLTRLGKGSGISEGQEVGLRLDIPAYTQKGVWIPTIHDKKGKPIAHESVAMVTDATFPDSGEKAMRVAVGGNKSPFAVINGKWKQTTPSEVESMAQSVISDDSWIQVGFDPTRHSYFYDRKNHRSQVVSADEVIQIGPLVLAKNAQTKALTNQSSDIRFHPGVDEVGIVSQENMPGYNSGILRGLHSAAPSEKMAFHKALQKALHYKKGDQLINIIAEEMGVDASEMATGISAYLNSKAFLEMNPATQVTGFPSMEMAELYALLHGYFTYQEAVSAYKPEYGLTPGGDWGDPSILADFILRDKKGNSVKATAAQVKKIHKIIEAHTSHMPPGEFGDPQAGDIAYFLTDNGFRLMFLDLPSNPDMNSQIFADIAANITTDLKINEDDIEQTTTKSIYQTNEWGVASSGSGQAYRSKIADKASKAGQPDLLGRLERRLGPILQPVYDKFAKKGLGNPGTQPGVVREVAGVTLPRTMSQLSDADALTIANKVAPVKRGEDPYSAIEAREIVEDYMAWDKLSATEGDQFMGELKRVAGVNQKQLMDAKRKGKESVGQLKEKQVPAKAEMEGIPRKNQSVVFKNNDKVHFGIPKVSDVKYAIKWDKNKGKDGAFVVGASHMAKSDVFPNIVLDGELGKAIEKPDHHASVFEATKKLNELVSGDPEKATSKQGYLEFMKKVGASSNALVVPSTLEVALTNPKLMADMILGDRLHGKRKIETRQNALDGLDGTLEFREAIGEGQAPDNRVTALLHLWGILSRMLPPLDQEGLWLRMMANRDVLEAVHKSTEGKFNLSEAKWKKIVAESRDMTDKNAAKIGNNATSNANSFHAALKLLNGKWDELGKSFATNDHSQMRQQYWDVVAKRGSL